MTIYMNDEKPIHLQYVADLDELQFFWDYIVPPLRPQDVYIMTQSARTKNLSIEERQKIKLKQGKAMYNEQTFHTDSFKRFLAHIRRFEVPESAFLDNNDNPIPQHITRIYWLLQPVDMIRALPKLQDKLSNALVLLANVLLKENNQQSINQAIRHILRFARPSKQVLNDSPAPKVWLDFDIDLVNKLTDTDYQKIRSVFDEYFNKGDVAYIQTNGGLHVLTRTGKLKTKPETLVQKLHETGINAKEILFNKNNQIPLPGTYMNGDFVPKILNKEDFDESHKFIKQLDE